MSGYPVSGPVSGKLSSQYPVQNTSTSTGFKPGSWFSVIHCIYPVTCLYVTSSLWCAVRVTGSCSQAALSGKLRSRQAALTVTVPSIKPAGSIQPLESRLENRNNLEIRNISRFIFYYYWNSKIVIIIDLLLCTRNNIRIL